MEIVEEDKDTEGEDWGRFFGAAVRSAYRTIGPKGTRPEKDGTYTRIHVSQSSPEFAKFT